MSEHVCAKKVVYYSKLSAKKKTENRRHLHWYECPHCGFWHVSSLSRNEYLEKKRYYEIIGGM